MIGLRSDQEEGVSWVSKWSCRYPEYREDYRHPGYGSHAGLPQPSYPDYREYGYDAPPLPPVPKDYYPSRYSHSHNYLPPRYDWDLPPGQPPREVRRAHRESLRDAHRESLRDHRDSHYGSTEFPPGVPYTSPMGYKTVSDRRRYNCWDSHQFGELLGPRRYGSIPRHSSMPRYGATDYTADYSYRDSYSYSYRYSYRYRYRCSYRYRYRYRYRYGHRY